MHSLSAFVVTNNYHRGKYVLVAEVGGEQQEREAVAIRMALWRRYNH